MVAGALNVWQESRNNHRTDYRPLVHELDLPGRADRLLICIDLAHVDGWESYNLHDLANVFWIGSVLYRSCTISHRGRLGSR